MNQASVLSQEDQETAMEQAMARIKELEQLIANYRTHAANVIHENIQQRHQLSLLAHANATLWGRLQREEEKRATLERIVDTETPIGALDLATTWKTEKQAYMERIEALERLAHAVVNSAARELNYSPDVLLVSTAALGELAHCVSSNSVEQASTPVEETREHLAAYAHEAWSGWMRYLFSKTERMLNAGQVVIPDWAVKRWTRQMNTPYADLPESEKESDRAEADKMLAIMRAASASPPRAAGGGG